MSRFRPRGPPFPEPRSTQPNRLPPIADRACYLLLAPRRLSVVVRGWRGSGLHALLGQHRVGRDLDVPGQTEALEAADEASADVELPPVHLVVGRAREGVVVVVPGLA